MKTDLPTLCLLCGEPGPMHKPYCTAAPVSHETACVSAVIRKGEVDVQRCKNCGLADPLPAFSSLMQQLAAAQAEIERLKVSDREWERICLKGVKTIGDQDDLLDKLVQALNIMIEGSTEDAGYPFSVARAALSDAAKFREGGG